MNWLMFPNEFKAKVDDLNVGKLRTVPKDLKILSDVVAKGVVKKMCITLTKY